MFNRRLFKEGFKRGYKKAMLKESTDIETNFILSAIKSALYWALCRKITNGPAAGDDSINLSAIVHRISEDLYDQIRELTVDAIEYAKEDLEEEIYKRTGITKDSILIDRAEELMDATANEEVIEQIVSSVFEEIVSNLGRDKI